MEELLRKIGRKAVEKDRFGRVRARQSSASSYPMQHRIILDVVNWPYVVESGKQGRGPFFRRIAFRDFRW